MINSQLNEVNQKKMWSRLDGMAGVGNFLRPHWCTG